MGWDDENLIQVLQNGGVAIMPTDTLYGIVGVATNISTVQRIYAAKKRTPTKPCIILIGDVSELEKFSISATEAQKNKLTEYWGALGTPTSIILECLDESFAYLHRDTKTLAFRLPQSQTLKTMLLKTGPLIAPSANPEGLPPAQTIDEAKEYFRDLLDVYSDGGMISGKASRVLHIHQDGSVTILRE